MLAEAERARLLALMGVPRYVLRANELAAESTPDATQRDAPASQAAAAETASSPAVGTGSNHDRRTQHASLDALSASIRASAEAMGKPVRAAPKRGPMPVLVGQLPQWPGLQRDLARTFGQTQPQSTPAQWPAYAVVLGSELSVPASVISVRVTPPLRSASAKRALWRQLRPLLATARPG